MKKYFKAMAVMALALLSLSSQAVLWHATNEWNMDWEKKFSSWIKTSAVHEQLFVGESSPYNGIKADCADASYALRAIFSLENSLPFRVTNPSGGRNAYNYLSNELTKFDSISNPKKRLVAFINYLGGQIGTEHLSHYDTAPVKVNSIRPGMLFTYKIKRFTGKTIRHSYNIKDVTATGNFDVIYSTQAIAKGGLPMIARRDYIFSNAPHGVWGFKRFNWPRLQNQNYSQYPVSFAYSTEQFSLVDQLGKKKFFRYVRDTLQSQEETAQAMIERSLNTLCTMANDRITYVNQAIDHMDGYGRSCMNYSDYDAYSTPSRDASLKEAFELLFSTREEIEDRGLMSEVDAELWESVYAIQFGESFAPSHDLYNLCSINYRAGKTIHLSELYRRLKAGLLSSHPNDLITHRWGETSRGGTSCRVWY